MHLDLIFAKPKSAERFWAKVDKKEPTECWLWLGAKDNTKYGAVKISTRKFLPYLVAYAYTYKIWPAQGSLMHTCKAKICCNPEHIKPKPL